MLSGAGGEYSSSKCHFLHSPSTQGFGLCPGARCSLFLSADYSLSILGMETLTVRGVACERDGIRESGHDREADVWAPCPITLLYGFGVSHRVTGKVVELERL